MTRETAINADRPIVMTLGLFDGVHRAHQTLIRQAFAKASELGGLIMVYTMSRHPMEILNPERAPRALQPLPARVTRLFDTGANTVLVRSFDPMFASLPAETFVNRLIQRYHPADIFVGFNYSFGAKGVGTPEMLARLSGRHGYRLHVLQPELFGNEVVSSTRIRHLLERGDIEHATVMLGRRYELFGAASGDKAIRVSARYVIPKPGLYTAIVNTASSAIETPISIQQNGLITLGADIAALTDRVRIEIVKRQ